MSKRLDVYLHERGLAESRSKAVELIKNGGVTVDGEVITKASFPVSDASEIQTEKPPVNYVSRAGYKLETAVEAFGIDFADKVCLDAGASTGGFTDLMLQKGARKIYAVDVGENQLCEKLKNNPRVVSFENQDVRTLELPEKVDFITADLSFISLKLIIPGFAELLKPDGHCAVLIKPQFEAGKIKMKNGVLTDKKLIEKIVKDIENFIVNSGYKIIGTAESKLNQKGKNNEFICYFKRG